MSWLGISLAMINGIVSAYFYVFGFHLKLMVKYYCLGSINEKISYPCCAWVCPYKMAQF